MEDVALLVKRLERMKKRLRELEARVKELEEENAELRAEVQQLKARLQFFEELWRKSAVIRREDEIERVREMLREHDGVRVVPFRYRVTVEYADTGGGD